MKDASRLTLKLTLGRVDVNEQVKETLDGAMSAAPTRGQSPRRQKHHHRHRHHRHQRHPNLRNNNNHHHHLHHGHMCHGRCQHSSQECQETLHDSLRSSKKRTRNVDNQKEEEEEEEEEQKLTEKRPKVNPIFLWALQREQKIIEVRCEDYDKRNRIKLTKTAHGWRSIPRTSSNSYSACCCIGSSYLPTTKDNKLSLLSPSVTSSCVPCTMSSKTLSSPPSSCSESTSFSSRSSLSTVKSQKDINCVKKTRMKKKKISKKRTRRRRTRCQVSDDESDATRSSCRNSRMSYDIFCEDDQHEDPDNVHYNRPHEKFDEYEFEDEEENTRFISYGRTYRLIDLEKLKKNQLLQPRVVLEPLNTARLHLARLNASSKALDDEIEMIVEDEEEEDEIVENIKDNRINVEGSEEFISNHEKKNVDTEDEVEEIEDKEDIEELDEGSVSVFGYEDRDFVDMMDESEFQEREDNILNSMEKLPPVPDQTFYEIPNSHHRPKPKKKSYLEDNIEEEEDIMDNVPIKNQKKRVPRSILQVPDLKPISESLGKISPRSSSVNSQTNQTYLRVLPSPPCSVTCSEDVSHSEIVKSSISQSTSEIKHQRREAPDLIEVKPTEWRRRELLRPANQLRELIKRSGGSIPDPLLVPRDHLPILAASPATEIPRLLITRPELRLPEALSRPEFLTDPDLLVISLAHLQQVLDTVPKSKSHLKEKNKLSHHKNSSTLSERGVEKNRLSCKPIGSLMPAPMDLSRHSTVHSAQNSVLRVRSGLLRRDTEVTSTARLPGDDLRLWHPLFNCRQKDQEYLNLKLPLQPQDKLQQPENYQQQQDSSQQRVSWHRTTLAS
ncbi:uncharacterized protein [Chelonus insularis]|uniref:uncharacterized protein n=1 Tax=Chelonus insularis TaxID=460826 RepID=UPI00158ECF95|nr:uncharacterized protein LOC118074341 [Chelonus insularis]